MWLLALVFHVVSFKCLYSFLECISGFFSCLIFFASQHINKYINHLFKCIYEYLILQNANGKGLRDREVLNKVNKYRIIK